MNNDINVDHYKILECSNTDTLDHVKKKYKELCLKYHPDKYSGSSEKFIKINTSYQHIITNETKKNHIFEAARNYMLLLYLMIKPKNIFINIKVDLEDIYKGSIKKVNYKHYVNGKKNVNSVFIDLNNFQQTYVFDEAGDENPISKNKGDLYASCDVISPPKMSLKKISYSYDIIYSLEINLYEYLYGLKSQYKFLNNETLNLSHHIPNLHGLQLTIQNKGIPYYNINDDLKRGNLIINLTLSVQSLPLRNNFYNNENFQNLIHQYFNT